MEGASKKLLGGSELIKPEMGLLQSKELYQYILETSVYPNESEFLKELRIATSTLPWSFMLCSPDQGPLMTLLLKLVNAKKTLEIGVFTGYSLLVTALSLPQDGKVIGIDPDRKAYEVGLPIIKKAGVEHKIDFIESPALSVLDNLFEDPKNEGTFDYAFVDADKGNYKNYYERLMKLIRIGGIVLFDNTLWSGTVAWKDDSNLDEFMKGAKDTMIELNKFLASDSRVHMCLLPVGDGLTLCIRLK